MRMRILFCGISVFCLLASVASAYSCVQKSNYMEVEGNNVYFEPRAGSAVNCSTDILDLMINATNFQSGKIKIKCVDPDCCELENFTVNNSLPLLGSCWDGETFSFALSTNLTGNITMGNVTVHCLNNSRCTTDLKIGYPESSIEDPDGYTIDITFTNGQFSCRSLCGDVAPYPDGDGEIKPADVTVLWNYYVDALDGTLDKYSLLDTWVGDVLCGNGIQPNDVVRLWNHYVDALDGAIDKFPLECCPN